MLWVLRFLEHYNSPLARRFDVSVAVAILSRQSDKPCSRLSNPYKVAVDARRYYTCRLSKTGREWERTCRADLSCRDTSAKSSCQGQVAYSQSSYGYRCSRLRRIIYRLGVVQLLPYLVSVSSVFRPRISGLFDLF